MGQENITLLPEAKVLKLHTSASGQEVTGVEVEMSDEQGIRHVQMFASDIVVVACGAINSAVLLLRSANDHHPYGLANRSQQVGRNFMKHVLGSIIGVTRKPNPTLFQKTLSINDFYWGEAGYDYPMGQVQTLGKVSKEALEGNAAAYARGGWFILSVQWCSESNFNHYGQCLKSRGTSGTGTLSHKGNGSAH